LLLFLYIEDVEIKSSAHNPKSFLAALEFLIPTNAIKRFSVDINDKVLPWSDGDILSMIRILRVHQAEIKSLAFRHRRWKSCVGVGISEWVRESHIHGLVLSIPEIPLAGDRTSPLVISMSNLQYLYLTESSYSIDIPHVAILTKLYMTCGSLGLNILAKWLVHLQDLRIKTLVIDEPFDESIQMKQLLHMYIGLIPVGLAGEYMVKLVAACPKVSISNLTEQLTHLALLNV
jgi:hypothetical protein